MTPDESAEATYRDAPLAVLKSIKAMREDDWPLVIVVLYALFYPFVVLALLIVTWLDKHQRRHDDV